MRIEEIVAGAEYEGAGGERRRVVNLLDIRQEHFVVRETGREKVLTDRQLEQWREWKAGKGKDPGFDGVRTRERAKGVQFFGDQTKGEVAIEEFADWAERRVM